MEVINPIKMGCSHYERSCEILSPCCNKYYSCHLCHDEQYIGPKNSPCIVERMDRTLIKMIKCNKCKKEQSPNQICIECSENFANYFCPKCNLFENSPKKPIFHCEECGICRKGNKENFFHCKQCNGCFGILLQNNHKCLVNSFNQNCSICLENLFYSRDESMNLTNCQHWMHVKCFKNYIRTSNTCPICCRSLYKMSDEDIKHIDEEIEKTKDNLPLELKDKKVDVLCNDCLKTTKEANFHYFGVKCTSCNSYNTKMI